MKIEKIEKYLEEVSEGTDFSFTVGNSNDERDIERTIIRSQIQYVKSAVSDFYDDIPDFPNRDEWRAVTVTFIFMI